MKNYDFHLPGFNLSIQWKLLASFLIVFSFPLLMRSLGAPWPIIITSGLALSLGLAFYCGWRILDAVRHIQGVTTRLGDLPGAAATRPERNRSPLFTDELSTLSTTIDRITSSLEKASTETGLQESRINPVGTSSRMVRAGISTGDPITGIIALMPRRPRENRPRMEHITGRIGQLLFEDAIRKVAERLDDMAQVEGLEEKDKAILEFQRLILADETFTGTIGSRLSHQEPLLDAIEGGFDFFKTLLEEASHPYMRARVHDCEDLKHQLIEAIVSSGDGETTPADISGKIVLCNHVYPSDIITLHRAGAKGIISHSGTPSSHAQILLKSLGIPSLTNIEPIFTHRLIGKTVLLDTINKKLYVEPEPEELAVINQNTTRRSTAPIMEPVTLRSGQPIRVFATVNDIYMEAEMARDHGADGIGLFRSEISFIGRATLPNEKELEAEYKILVDSFPNKPIHMRILDIGGDKLQLFQNNAPPLKEENPCLGNRSIRFLLREENILKIQLRAMLKAANERTTILFPMISGWYELEALGVFIREIRGELKEEGYGHVEAVKFGLMVEVPSVVERFEDYVDSFSVFNVGTNDLTQYTLAADRNNREVSEYYKYYHPSVLSMIRKICTLTSKKGKMACLCGEMATDPSLLPLLIGLGVRSFSCHYSSIPVIKSIVRELKENQCRKIAEKVLACRSTRDVEKLLV